MKQATALLCFFLCLLVLGSCSPKETFYLAKGTGKFSQAEKEQIQGKVKTRIPSAFESLSRTTAPDSLLITASVQSGPFGLLVSEKKLPAILKTAEPEKANRDKDLKQLRPIKKMQKTVAKKLGYTPEEGVKPKHKLARLGFILSLGGLFSLVLIALSGAALLLLLTLGLFIAGYSTSRKGFLEIKKVPDQYGGKGMAIAGMIMPGFLLLALVAFILYILAFAGAFS